MNTIKRKIINRTFIADRVEESNKIINLFMGEYNVHNIPQYNTSWDLLMDVIHKIKSKVFHEGYDMFMPEHHSYVAIGNACYDADLFEAWKSCVKWITLNLDLAGINFDNIGAPKEDKHIVYKTKEVEYFKVSPHAIRRYKQRINFDTSVEEICKILSTKELYKAYKLSGDGKYHLTDGVVVAIDGCKIITTYRKSTEGFNDFEKVGDLSISHIYKH